MITTPRYIVIEGAIGVGKTTLARILATELDAVLIEEAIEENPFINKFYKDRKSHAFQTQIFFLLSRYQQQLELQQPDLFKRSTVTDYLFDKDRIFAAINLDEQEMALYEKLHNMLQESIVIPDLVIYLQASTDTLMQRVRERGRHYEKNMSREYLDEVNRAYNKFFFNYNKSPLLIIDTSEINFVKNKEDLNRIREIIHEPRHGIQYYVPVPK